MGEMTAMKGMMKDAVVDILTERDKFSNVTNQ